MDKAVTTLTEDMIELLAVGVAHQVGACSADGRPVLCRALAAQLEADGRVAVIISGVSAFEVLDAIRRTRRVSVNFTVPTTYRSLNLAGNDAEVDLGGTAYRALVDARHRAFRDQLATLGFTPDYTAAVYSAPDDDLMAIRFTPIVARNQTPGPGAGESIALKPA